MTAQPLLAVKIDRDSVCAGYDTDPHEARAFRWKGPQKVTIQDLLGIELPIIQAPMAGAQGSALAVAVSNAGGLGSLPVAMLTPDSLRAELATLKANTEKPFNVNFFCHTDPISDPAREAIWRAALLPYYREFGIDPTNIAAGPTRAPFNDAFADILEEFRPPVVSFHFGVPAPQLLARVKATGAKILSSATTVVEALWLEAQGVDAIIAQGLEAGGHRGMFLTGDLTTQVGTVALVPQIVAAVQVPVIAAGGIADAPGVAAALALGAVGVQAGTAYLLCPESTISAFTGPRSRPKPPGIPRLPTFLPDVPHAAS
jgi:nitronate monooxygenase